MSVHIWTGILVAVTFAPYFGIAIWVRAVVTKEFDVDGARFAFRLPQVL